MKEIKGFILYADYLNHDEKTIVRLFGKSEDGKSFCSLHNVEPYFYIEEKNRKHIPKDVKKENIQKTALTTFQKEPVIKITAENQTELNKFSSELHKAEIDTFESDIKPVQRFLIDHNLLNSITLEGDSEPSERIDRIFKNPKVAPSSFVPELKIISIDIETDKSSNEIYCIGIYGKNYKKNFIVSDKKLEHSISCKNEADCLEKFKAELLKLDPDIITGWNMVDFDLKVLQGKFAEHKIPFDLGRTNEPITLRIESSFFRKSSVDIPGRQVLDAMALIKDPFIQEAPSIKNAEFENYTLESVATAILGKGKLLKGKDRHDEISDLYNSKKTEDLQRLVDYNLLDCQLVYDILEKCLQVSNLTNLQHPLLPLILYI